MLRLRRDLLDAVVAHCRAEAPLEACGVLAGRDGVPERHIPMRNAEASRTRYAMDPDQQLAVWREMDERGEQPVVIYHSHPATEAKPSAPDVRFMAEPRSHYVIVSLRGELPEVRSWRMAAGAGVVCAGAVTEEPIDVIHRGEWKTEYFHVGYMDGSLWVTDIDGGPDDGWLIVPHGGLDDLIAALKSARRVTVDRRFSLSSVSAHGAETRTH